jgi:translation elongation factor EF-1beta
MKALEAAVRGIEKDGLVWGASKLVAVGFGIKKLQINLVIEDDKIGLDDLQEEISEFEDYVQSTDIVSIILHPSSSASPTPPKHRLTGRRLLCKSYRLLLVYIMPPSHVSIALMTSMSHFKLLNTACTCLMRT